MILKEKIIHESLKLFSLKGFLSTSLQDIISAAGTSKGGFYNHFSSKEDLFFHALDEARKIWRERNLAELKDIESPLGKIIKLLGNFRDRYLKDSENFPGGCIFITFAVELSDQRPKLSREVRKGFVGLKRLIKRLMEEALEAGELDKEIHVKNGTEILYSGLLGATVIYGIDKSPRSLDDAIDPLIDYIENLNKGNIRSTGNG
ncbi:MAG: TetR/AcrR family transcriptional regulator [Desulfobacterales bacterium]|nr:TetR/AcrR family transcriptional regulator [Desulfobacterales bacterium]